ARVVDDLDLLPQAAEKISLSADQSGYVHDLDALCLGRAANLLGAGREGEVGEIDPAAGIRLLKKIGDSVKEEEPFVQLQFNRARNIKKAKHLAKNAISTGTEPPQESDLVLDRIS
ncbi:MAG: pyrimidine-nucleoside phosphorylase, partial [Candidatus Bipolaricaulota bacterium]